MKPSEGQQRVAEFSRRMTGKNRREGQEKVKPRRQSARGFERLSAPKDVQKRAREKKKKTEERKDGRKKEKPKKKAGVPRKQRSEGKSTAIQSCQISERAIYINGAHGKKTTTLKRPIGGGGGIGRRKRKGRSRKSQYQLKKGGERTCAKSTQKKRSRIGEPRVGS